MLTSGLVQLSMAMCSQLLRNYHLQHWGLMVKILFPSMKRFGAAIDGGRLGLIGSC